MGGKAKMDGENAGMEGGRERIQGNTEGEEEKVRYKNNTKDIQRAADPSSPFESSMQNLRNLAGRQRNRQTDAQTGTA